MNGGTCSWFVYSTRTQALENPRESTTCIRRRLAFGHETSCRVIDSWRHFKDFPRPAFIACKIKGNACRMHRSIRRRSFSSKASIEMFNYSGVVYGKVQDGIGGLYYVYTALQCIAWNGLVPGIWTRTPVLRRSLVFQLIEWREWKTKRNREHKILWIATHWSSNRNQCTEWKLVYEETKSFCWTGASIP